MCLSWNLILCLRDWFGKKSLHWLRLRNYYKRIKGEKALKTEKQWKTNHKKKTNKNIIRPKKCKNHQTDCFIIWQKHIAQFSDSPLGFPFILPLPHFILCLFVLICHGSVRLWLPNHYQSLELQLVVCGEHKACCFHSECFKMGTFKFYVCKKAAKLLWRSVVLRKLKSKLSFFNVPKFLLLRLPLLSAEWKAKPWWT